MNSYTGLHVTAYDVLYADKAYAGEARFVHELINAPGGRLLDVACGTGRHAMAFADLGYEVTGVDVNEELLAHARVTAGDRIEFVVGDMRELDLSGQPFDVVTCLFDSIGYAVGTEAVLAALRTLGRHASPAGVVVCEFLHAAALLRSAAETRVRRCDLPDGRTLLRISETALDVERMVMQVHYDLLALDSAGGYEWTAETQTNRFFSAPEMRLLASSAGLETRAIVPAYEHRDIDADTFHLLLVAAPAA